jgi:hypothetical protein
MSVEDILDQEVIVQRSFIFIGILYVLNSSRIGNQSDWRQIVLVATVETQVEF